ncbi:phosphatase PAP2 family protein [Trinickia sp. YCB016]
MKNPAIPMESSVHQIRLLNWWLCIVLAGTDFIALEVAHIELAPAGVVRTGVAGAALLILRFVYSRVRPEQRICAALDTVLYLVIFSQAAAVLNYLILGTGTPVADAWYSRADAALGFHWPAWFGFVRAHSPLAETLHFANALLMPQMIAVVFVLAFSARLDELRAFATAVTAAYLATLFVTALAPAAGAWTYYPPGPGVDLSQFSDFELLRNHALLRVDLTKLQDLVSMPSFHAAVAVLCTWAMRRSGAWFWPCALASGLIVLSTPTEGGHYLVDVLGGIAVASAAIGWTSYMSRK